jgi:hypothetical protein
MRQTAGVALHVHSFLSVARQQLRLQSTLYGVLERLLLETIPDAGTVGTGGWEPGDQLEEKIVLRELCLEQIRCMPLIAGRPKSYSRVSIKAGRATLIYSHCVVFA